MENEIQINYEGLPCYKIVFQKDFSKLASMIEDLDKKYDNICIVTDSNVEKIYLENVHNELAKVFDNISAFVFNAGEQSKNLATVEKLYLHLINLKCTRNTLLVALGGGVVGDLTGFAASTFLRGVDFIQVPTTLLSQVDSSVGGKTGVDFQQYKNMVGAFYMPKLVYMNLNTLHTLDDANYVCGLGEVVKSALIQNKEFYNWIKLNVDLINSKNDDALLHMVYECCLIKGHVVEIDPKEKGIRCYLNFGHTLGHAIEKLSNFAIGHGQCVSIGMVAALFLSNKLNYISKAECDEIIELLHRLNMPTECNNLSTEEILLSSKSDKKMVSNKVKFVVLKNIGEATSYMDFTDNDLREAIDVVNKKNVL